MYAIGGLDIQTNDVIITVTEDVPNLSYAAERFINFEISNFNSIPL